MSANARLLLPAPVIPRGLLVMRCFKACLLTGGRLVQVSCTVTESVVDVGAEIRKTSLPLEAGGPHRGTVDGEAAARAAKEK